MLPEDHREMRDSTPQLDFDVLIIGSGFGGSVPAMRLSQKGYRVGVLETGKRYNKTDFAKSNWDFKRYLWLPLFRCFGIQRFTFMRGLAVMHGAGVGGGSLVYANTLVQPAAEVFENTQWPSDALLPQTLNAFFLTAKKMLGVTSVPKLYEADLELKKLSKKFNAENTFAPTEVGVFFGPPEQTSPDPYFEGKGPSRSGCEYCGACMVGCRVGAKNSLDYNYLYFAEKNGAEIIPETTVTRIEPFYADSDLSKLNPLGYWIHTKKSTDFFGRAGKKYFAKKVIISAGVLGTLKLLFKSKHVDQTLPLISDQLGRNVRSNGESLLGVTSVNKTRDFSKGVAIGSIFSLNATTHVEAVRYPLGSTALRILAVPLTAIHSWIPRSLLLLVQFVKRLPQMIRLLFVGDWAKQSIILLVMQTVDQKISLNYKNFFGHDILKVDTALERLPSYLPSAQEAAKLLATQINGEPLNIAPEVLMDMTVTAHILGGCCMGSSNLDSVVDLKHEVHGYPGLFVSDASVIASNLGVNPSLTITALAERFSSFWKDLKSEDHRS